MGIEKLFRVKVFILILVLFVFLTGFEVKKTTMATVQGKIEAIDKDYKSMTVNGTKFSITPGAKIVDPNGNAVNMKDLKPGTPVTIEGLSTGGAFSTKGIVVAPPKSKP